MRPLPAAFQPYRWAPSTVAIARFARIRPEEVLRFDGNTPPRPLPTSNAAALAEELGRIHTYPHGGYERIHEAIARYAGVARENVVLGAGADDLIMLVARAYAGAGDIVSVADEPTYPVLRGAVFLAGAEVGDARPVLTFCCRPHNPTGALVALPAARPLAVDEAYFEYARESAVGLLKDGVVVIRTFSKAFGLAGARIGYLLAEAGAAEELRARQSPAPVSTLSVALALAALAAGPPDVSETLRERDRLTSRLRELAFEPLPSHTNFVFVPVADAAAVQERLLRRGLAVRAGGGGIRITVRDPVADERLLAELRAATG